MKLFGTSGVRGIYGESITPELGISLGLALAKDCVIGRDPRVHSVILQEALASGVMSAGGNVTKLGMVPTPALAFAAAKLEVDGVMITASHNPKEYNGFKFFGKDGMAYASEQEELIEDVVEKKSFSRAGWDKIPERTKEYDVLPEYIDSVKKIFDSSNFRIVLDCGNGAACVTSPKIFDAKIIFGEPDGTFPNRASEPCEENLSQLMREVKKLEADIGIAHDGDGDRVAVVDELGKYVSGDALLAILCAGKKVAVPINTSKVVEDVAREVVYTPVGDVAVAQEIRRSGCEFGGENCGAHIYPEESLCPDGALSAQFLLKLLEKDRRKLSEIVAELPRYHTVNAKIEGKEKLYYFYEKAKALGGEVKEIDGVRVDLEDGWVLVRASGTEDKIRVTAESQDEKRAKGLLKLVI